MVGFEIIDRRFAHHVLGNAPPEHLGTGFRCIEGLACMGDADCLTDPSRRWPSARSMHQDGSGSRTSPICATLRSSSPASRSAACRNLRLATAEDPTCRYDALCAHYGMQPSRNNPGVAHENGAIESAHGHLEAGIAGALLLRGARDFADLAGYRGLVDEVTGRHNARVEPRLAVERASLQGLPPRRTADHEEAVVTVTSFSGLVPHDAGSPPLARHEPADGEDDVSGVGHRCPPGCLGPGDVPDTATAADVSRWPRGAARAALPRSP